MFNEAIYKCLKSSAPLFEALQTYKEQNLSLFHTPGHKATCVSPFYDIFGDALKYDVTELPQTDSLYDADGAIYEAEVAAAKHFSVKHTLFSAGGATLCIQAMLRLVQKRGNKIICARNVHRSVVNAMALLAINPVWVYPTQFENNSMQGYISVNDIERELAIHPDAEGVFITSPNYYGVLSDTKSIAEVCKKYDVPLLIDNAHGSHLFYVGDGNLHPIRQGASLTCDSAHKTLPVLTGGAFLQINSDKFSYRDAKEAMSIFGSTSPSYLVMLSLDIARAWLEENGVSRFDELCSKVCDIKSLCIQKGFKFSERAIFDPARLTLDFSSVGYTGFEAGKMLYEYGISSEMQDECNVVLLPSPFNKSIDFDRLQDFINNIDIKKPLSIEHFNFRKHESVMTLNEAMFAQKEVIPIDKASSRIVAECRIPCPPGVPVVMPGEIISDEALNNLKKYGILNIKVIK